MAFGFGVSDIVLLAKTIITATENIRDAPKELQELLDRVDLVGVTLEAIDQLPYNEAAENLRNITRPRERVKEVLLKVHDTVIKCRDKEGRVNAFNRVKYSVWDKREIGDLVVKLGERIDDLTTFLIVQTWRLTNQTGPPIDQVLTRTRREQDRTKFPDSSTVLAHRNGGFPNNTSVPESSFDPGYALILREQQRALPVDGFSSQSMPTTPTDRGRGNAPKVANNGWLVKKRKSFESPSDKKKIAETRALFACIPCASQRIKCKADQSNPDGACLACLRSTRKGVPLQCFRLKISVTALFRDGPTSEFRWTARVVETASRDLMCPKPAIRHLRLTQGLAQRLLPLDVERCDPQPEDMQHYNVETPRGKGWFECPPFVVANVYQATENLIEYLDIIYRDYISNLLHSKDHVLKLIFEMALHRLDSATSEDKKNKLIGDSLKLWVAVRFTEQPWRIDDQETPDMKTALEPFSPYHNQIPITPVMDIQIDQIVIKNILKPLGTSILSHLKDLYTDNANKQRHWLKTFLCSAILLNNYEVAIAHDFWFARRHGLRERYSNPKLVEAFRTGAKTVLAHYHTTCNGDKPFTLDWSNTSDVLVAAAELDDVERNSMIAIIASISNNTSRFRRLQLSGHPEEDLYFTSQLFEPTWGQIKPDA